MKFCLIGEKLGHSYSAILHNARGFDYVLNPLKKDELTSFCKNCKFDGFNVTIPYKKDIFEQVDFISDLAKEVGAVNTVCNRDGKLYGYNTDVGGLRYMLARKGVTLKDKNVLLLGSGGASNTARTLAKIDGANKIWIVSRSGEVNYSNYKQIAQSAQIIINTTPVGMYPNGGVSPITLDGFDMLEGVFDCIYNPLQTELLRLAEKRGVACSGGLSMLVEQALLAEDIWTNSQHTQEDSEKTLARLSAECMNIVLFGMPSCGKSTLGKNLATTLSREFIDTDLVIQQRTGKTPSQIIKESGEKVFRDIESEVIKSVASLSGKVISLGGGGVLREENVRELRSNGVLIYIKRPLELLSEEDRPLSAQKGIIALYNERKEIYENAKDRIVVNDGEIDKAVKEIISEYEIACNKRC